MIVLILLMTLSNQKGPHFRFEEKGLQVFIDPNFLKDPNVRKNLESGLTTTLEIHAIGTKEKGQQIQGGAQVFIRYELWDEVFLIDWLDMSSTSNHVQVKDMKELISWLGTHGFFLVGETKGSQLTKLDLVLRVLPFSQTEQHRAQKWMSRTIAAQQNKPGGSQSSKQVMDLIIGTSVKRPVLIEFNWQLDLEQGGKP